jgi:hypothetical protein
MPQVRSLGPKSCLRTTGASCIGKQLHLAEEPSIGLGESFYATFRNFGRLN